MPAGLIGIRIVIRRYEPGRESGVYVPEDDAS
jgi:hypothetical protein